MLSSALFVSAMGLVWTFLWKQPIEDMLPFLAVGMMVWQMITGILNESATALPASSHYFLNQYLPASAVLYAVFYRNVAMFLLNMVYPLLLCIAFGVPLTWYALCSAIGLVLVIAFCFSMAYVIAILCTRFRDIVQIVASFLNVVFFITPVLWNPRRNSTKDRPLPQAEAEVGRFHHFRRVGSAALRVTRVFAGIRRSEHTARRRALSFVVPCQHFQLGLRNSARHLSLAQ